MMKSAENTTLMLGRFSRVETAEKVYDGTILAVGDGWISLAVKREVIHIDSSDIKKISATN